MMNWEHVKSLNAAKQREVATTANMCGSCGGDGLKGLQGEEDGEIVAKKESQGGWWCG